MLALFVYVNNVWFRNTSLLQINTESQDLRGRERASPRVHYRQPATHQHSGRLSDYPRGLLARALPLLSTSPFVYKAINLLHFTLVELFCHRRRVDTQSDVSPSPSC